MTVPDPPTTPQTAWFEQPCRSPACDSQLMKSPGVTPPPGRATQISSSPFEEDRNWRLYEPALLMTVVVHAWPPLVPSLRGAPTIESDAAPKRR